DQEGITIAGLDGDPRGVSKIGPGVDPSLAVRISHRAVPAWFARQPLRILDRLINVQRNGIEVTLEDSLARGDEEDLAPASHDPHDRRDDPLASGEHA